MTSSYILETGRLFKTKLDGHKKDVKNSPRVHPRRPHSHQEPSDRLRVSQSCRRSHTEQMKEAIWIHKTHIQRQRSIETRETANLHMSTMTSFLPARQSHLERWRKLLLGKTLLDMLKNCQHASS